MFNDNNEDIFYHPKLSLFYNLYDNNIQTGVNDLESSKSLRCTSYTIFQRSYYKPKPRLNPTRLVRICRYRSARVSSEEVHIWLE